MESFLMPPCNSLDYLTDCRYLKGATTEDGSGSTQLLRVDVPVFNLVQCRSIYGRAIDTTAVCVGYANGGKDACQGDSAGPYAINGQLVGIVSWGPAVLVLDTPGSTPACLGTEIGSEPMPGFKNFK
ncbi:hypothetical protein GWI33_005367 [Rhynchophorus ferrugineus]|uniref:Peptidase S1 domain-containing protein n=1 Tax=Rhynchophorus ferrugineus TaxID=354439 RepID=A0A834MDV0_RHYFE|nr:hypothetical protein GWI33_005367 [Rhynchophorus ferrugineus]